MGGNSPHADGSGVRSENEGDENREQQHYPEPHAESAAERRGEHPWDDDDGNGGDEND